MLEISHYFFGIFLQTPPLGDLKKKKTLQKAGEGHFTPAAGVKPPPPAFWGHSFF